MNKWLAVLCVFPIFGIVSVASDVFPAGDVAWTVEIEKDRESGGLAVPYPVRFEIQKKGNFRRDQITYSNGQMAERWWYVASGTFLLEKGLNGQEYFYSPNENTAATSFDASMFRWLDGKNPMGEEKWKGKECLVFSGEIQTDEVKTSRKAWIDKETGRVVGLQASGQTYVFTFHDEAPGTLDPPATLLKRADRARRIIGIN